MGRSYDSLRVYYDTNTKDVVVYNYKESPNVEVFNLYDLYRGNFNVFLNVNSKYDVIQSLIYSYEDNKSKLIIIDRQGIRLYNLRVSYFKNGKLIKEYDFCCNGMADFIGDGNKLLYIYNKNLVVFELNKFNIIYRKDSFIIGETAKCLLRIKDGNALVGTSSGNIYLIGFINEEIKILDKRKICDNTVYSLSYNNNCVEGKRECYTFLANCGYLLIFEIGAGESYSKSNILNIRTIFYFFILYLLF